MDDDHVAPDEFLPPRHPLPCDEPVMGDELQVEPGHPYAGVALARRRLADVADAALEGEVAVLDDVAEAGAVDRRRRHVDECGVALELRELEGRAQRADDHVDEIGEDVLSVVELHAGQVAAVPSDVGDDETGRFGPGEHQPGSAISHRIGSTISAAGARAVAPGRRDCHSPIVSDAASCDEGPSGIELIDRASRDSRPGYLAYGLDRACPGPRA